MAVEVARGDYAFLPRFLESHTDVDPEFRYDAIHDLGSVWSRSEDLLSCIKRVRNTV